MKRSIVFLMMALFIASCKKEGSNPVESIGVQEKVTDYYPLAVGNYWIYEYYTSDSTMNFIDQNLLDSVYVEKDSICNGNVCAVVCSSYWSEPSHSTNPAFIRDSSDYIVTNGGAKLFTINQDTSYLIAFYPYDFPTHHDSTFYMTWKMKNSDSVCVVPAGQYSAKYVIGSLKATKPTPHSMQERNYYYAYAKDIGLVSQRQGYVGSPDYYEECLIRYRINGKIHY
jgi:hypothetical protein